MCHAETDVPRSEPPDDEQEADDHERELGDVDEQRRLDQPAGGTGERGQPLRREYDAIDEEAGPQGG